MAVTDTGDEVGVMQRDGDLVRVKRAASCCRSGQALFLHKTGDYSLMSKFLRLTQGDIVYVLVRLLDSAADSWNFIVKAFQKVPDSRSFYEYFDQYCNFAANVSLAGRLNFKDSPTPKRRKAALEEDQKYGKPTIVKRAFPGNDLRMASHNRTEHGQCFPFGINASRSGSLSCIYMC